MSREKIEGVELAAKYRQALNVEAEQALLGACLANNEALNHVGNELLPEHFAAPLHQWIFEKLRVYRIEGKVCSPVTLAHLIDEEKVYAEKGYMAKLVGAAVSVINVADYARIVLECHIRRELQRAAHELLTSDPDTTPGDLASGLAAAVSAATGAAVSGKFHSAGQVTESILRKIDSRVKPFSTGIRRLDVAMSGGLYTGKLYALAGRKKHGKTILAGTISYNLNEQGVPHLFICGEMGEEEIHQRNLARAIDVDPRSFLEGWNGRPSDFRERIADYATYGPRNTIFYDAPGITFDRLKQVVASAVAKKKIRGFVLDYWQLVQGKERARNPVQFLDEVAQWLAEACKTYDIFGIVTSQVNKEGSTRGGEGLLNACDQGYLINRPNLNTPDTWLQMLETRYTRFMDVGTETSPGLWLENNGPYFRNADEQASFIPGEEEF